MNILRGRLEPIENFYNHWRGHYDCKLNGWLNDASEYCTSNFGSSYYYYSSYHECTPAYSRVLEEPDVEKGEGRSEYLEG